ncbi:MAG: hypothetical protein O2780_15740 [Proteobacteria bacterium]|jgi:hypothetical protein|nr:hypothetical protein [Pseudomonadota bacterium]
MNPSAMTFECLDGVIHLSIIGEISPLKLISLAAEVKLVCERHDTRKIILKRHEAPHSALRAFEHVEALRSLDPPKDVMMAFLAQSPADVKTMDLLVAIIDQAQLFCTKRFTDEQEALTWLDEGSDARAEKAFMDVH